MSDQEIQRGDVQVGGPDQLPYGGATEVQTQLDQAPPPPPAEPPPPPENVTDFGPAQEQQPEETFTPGSGATGLNPDDEKYLLSPTEQPNVAPTTMRMIPPDPDIQGWLPDLQAEAARPDAPPQLKAIFKAMMLGPEG